MKINVTKDKAKFFVDEKNKKVTCVIDNTAPLFLMYAYNNLPLTPHCDSGDPETSKLYKQLLLPNKFVGIATCGPDDEFSVETGKLIAFSRAKDNLNVSFFKRAERYINTINQLLDTSIDTINAYGQVVSRNSVRRHNKIDSVIGDE